jgi:hypothetical protein
VSLDQFGLDYLYPVDYHGASKSIDEVVEEELTKGERNGRKLVGLCKWRNGSHEGCEDFCF